MLHVSYPLWGKKRNDSINPFGCPLEERRKQKEPINRGKKRGAAKVFLF
jgi:hypothetical protein